jgi:adenosylcobinamide-GDP ribazoletransferase
MSSIRSAVALLTRVPLATAETDTPGAAAFGLVGAGVGIVAAIPYALLAGPLAEPWIGAIAAVAMIALVTGGLHHDGLADTADAVMARDAEAAERARKDPRLGTGGVLAIVLVIAAAIASLVGLAMTAGAMRGALVLVAVVTASRVVPVIVTVAARRADGAASTVLGAWFADRVGVADAAVALASAALISVALAVTGGPLVVLAALGTVVLGSAAGALIVALRRGLDGDAMGAIVELSVVAGLVVAAIAT